MIDLILVFIISLSAMAESDVFEMPVETGFKVHWLPLTQSLPESCVDPQVLEQELIRHRVDVSSFPEGSDSCPDGYQQKLYRIFNRLQNLRLEDSLAAPNPIVETLKNPLAFFESSYSSLSYYQSDRAYASFNPANRKMNLSDAFFQQPDVVGLAILMHESAHGRKEDPGHAQCYQGQLMAAYGGCDMQLSQKPEQSGAYGYEFWFSWMYSRYSDRLNMEERNYLRQKALDLATHRFNHVFEIVAFTDLLMGLDHYHQLLVYDPLKKQWKLLQHPKVAATSPATTVERIDYDARSHGLNLIMQDGRLVQWDSIARDFVRQLDLPFTAKQEPIHHIRRVFDFDVGAPRTVVFSQDGSLWRETTDLQNRGEKVFLPFQLPQSLTGHPVDIVSLIGPKSAFLESSGNLKIFEKDRFLDVELPGWPLSPLGIFPSLNGSTLYAIDADSGKLLEGRLVQRGIGPILELDRVEFAEDFLQAPTDALARKYQEGFAYRMLLNDRGSLSVSRHRHLIRTRPLPTVSVVAGAGQGLKDFAMVRTAQFQSNYDFDRNPFIKSRFERRCGVSADFKDPWLHRWMGVNGRGQWIVDDEGGCHVVLENVRQIQSGVFEISNNPFGYPESRVSVQPRNQAEARPFFPYEN